MWDNISVFIHHLFRSFQVILCSSLNQVLTFFDFSHRNKDNECHLQVLFGSVPKLGSPGYLVELEDMVVNSCWCHSLAKFCDQREFEESCTMSIVSVEYMLPHLLQRRQPSPHTQWQQNLLTQLEKVLAI